MLLPNQKAHLMAEVLNVGEHVRVSMALARAIKDNTVHQSIPSKSRFHNAKDSHYELRTRRFLDSAVMRDEFNKSSHMLDAVGPEMSLLRKHQDLWQFFHPMVPPAVDTNELHMANRLELSKGVRVLPVYVFSLMEMKHELLIDQESLVSASSDNVFVLQTESTNGRIPFHVDKSRLEKWQVTGTTHHVVAGLMSALGGLVPPGKHYSPLHNRTVQDWIMAVGHQPWGPFASTPGMSDLSTSLALRNFAITNLHVAHQIAHKVIQRLDTFTQKYLYDPFAEVEKEQIGLFSHLEEESVFPVQTITALNSGMEKLQEELEVVATLLSENKLKEAYEPATSLVERARSFEAYADTELQAAEVALQCCDIEHSTSKEVDTESLVYICGCAILVFAAVCLLFRSGGSSHKRRFA